MITSPFAAPRMSALQEYFFARANVKSAEAKTQGLDVINLGIGNPDLPPSSEVIETLAAAAQKPENNLYPSYNGLPEFRQAIADWYHRQYQLKLDPDQQILPVNGSKQGIIYLTLSFVGLGDQVLMPNPGYSAYEKAAVIAGATTVYYSLTAENHFLPDLAKLAKQDLSKVKLWWINYPHNPTGATISSAELQEIAEFAKQRHIILVNDNPYSHITFQGYHAPTLLSFLDADSPFLELSSMSKTYNMPGWRIGWIAGQSGLIALVKNMYSNIETGQFIPLQKAATVALAIPQSWIDTRNLIYAERKTAVLALLEKLHCQPYPSQASLYVWAKLPAEIQDAEAYVFQLLAKTGIFLAPGTAFGAAGEGYIRAAICQPTERILTAAARIH